MTSARILADSISPDGVRLTTMEVVMHRFVLAEFNTHRVFSRNSASSRAIPLMRQIKNIREGIAYPVSWPSEQPGMQGGDQIDDVSTAQAVWDDVADYAINAALRLGNLRLHKSVVNRLLEPFMYHKVLVTSTEWDNFFALRCHEMAQPEIRVAAELMQAAYVSSVPRRLDHGDWHAPFYEGLPHRYRSEALEEALKTSAACCAWVSTANHDGEHSWDAICRMYDRLSQADPIHASPFEHQATPGEGPGNFRGWVQLRHMIENDMVPWDESDAIVIEHLLTGKEHEVDGFIVGVEEDLLAGIEPLRKDREGDSQPLPVASGAPIAHRMVQEDLDARLALGIERYGQPLQAHNGRDSLVDAYEEALDLVVYLKNAIYERDNPQ